MAHFPSPYDSEKFDHELDEADFRQDENPASRISKASSSRSTTASTNQDLENQWQSGQHQQQQQPLIGVGDANGNRDAVSVSEQKLGSSSSCPAKKVVIIVCIAVLVAAGIGIGLGCGLCGSSPGENQQESSNDTNPNELDNKSEKKQKQKIVDNMNVLTSSSKKGSQQQHNQKSSKYQNRGEKEEQQHKNQKVDRVKQQKYKTYLVKIQDTEYKSKYQLNGYSKKPKEYNLSKFEPPSFFTLGTSDDGNGGNPSSISTDSDSTSKNDQSIDIYMQYVYNELYDGSQYAAISDKENYDPKNPPGPQRATNNLIYAEANIAAEWKGQLVDQVDLQSSQQMQQEEQKKLKKAQERLTLQKECFLAYAKMLKDGILTTEKYSSEKFTNPFLLEEVRNFGGSNYGTALDDAMPPASELSIENPYGGFLNQRVFKDEKPYTSFTSDADEDDIQQQNQNYHHADNFRVYSNGHNTNASTPQQYGLRFLDLGENSERQSLQSQIFLELLLTQDSIKAYAQPQNQVEAGGSDNKINHDFALIQLCKNRDNKKETEKSVLDAESKLWEQGKFSGPIGGSVNFVNQVNDFFSGYGQQFQSGGQTHTQRSMNVRPSSKFIPQKMVNEKKDLVLSLTFQNAAGGVDPELLTKGTSVSDSVSVYSSMSFVVAKQYIEENVIVLKQAQQKQKQQKQKELKLQQRRYLSQSEYDKYCAYKNEDDSGPQQFFQMRGHFIEMRYPTKKVIEQLKTQNQKYNLDTIVPKLKKLLHFDFEQKQKLQNKDQDQHEDMNVNECVQEADEQEQEYVLLADSFLKLVTGYTAQLQMLKDLQAKSRKETQKNKSFQHMRGKHTQQGLAVLGFDIDRNDTYKRYQEQVGEKIVEKEKENNNSMTMS